MIDILTPEPLRRHVLELAERLDWRLAEIAPDVTVGPGRDAWETWTASATRRRLARAIGVLAVRWHRERAA